MVYHSNTMFAWYMEILSGVALLTYSAMTKMDNCLSCSGALQQ